MDPRTKSWGIAVCTVTHMGYVTLFKTCFRAPSLLLNLICDPWCIVVQHTPLLRRIRGPSSRHTEVPNGALSHPTVIRYYNLLHSYITACTRKAYCHVTWPFWRASVSIFQFGLVWSCQDVWEQMFKFVHHPMTKNAPSPTYVLGLRLVKYVL